MKSRCASSCSGETWALPIGVALTLAAGAGAPRPVEGDYARRHAGGFVLLALVIVALWAGPAAPRPPRQLGRLPPAHPARRRRPGRRSRRSPRS